MAGHLLQFSPRSMSDVQRADIQTVTTDIFLRSPFYDCVDKFGVLARPLFQRPDDGEVNGYIKFRWPKFNYLRRALRAQSPSLLEECGLPRVMELNENQSGTMSDSAPQPTVAVMGPRVPPEFRAMEPDMFNYVAMGAAQSPPLADSPYRCNSSTSSPVPSDATMENIGAPQYIPSLYGYDAIMDFTDRRLWTFCTSCSRVTT